MGPLLMLLIGLLLIVGGILAASGFIISKKPQAKEMLDKIVPFQGIIGVILLVSGVIFLILWIGKASDINKLSDAFKLSLLPFTFYLGTACAIVLGFLLGMPLIAKWIPGDSPAEVKALEMQKKIAALGTIVGAVSIVFGLLMIYYRFKSIEIGREDFNVVKGIFGAYGK